MIYKADFREIIPAVTIHEHDIDCSHTHCLVRHACTHGKQ